MKRRRDRRFLKKVKKNKKVNLGGPGVTKTHGSVNRMLKREIRKEKTNRTIER
jgi:ATP-dependent RNA helicase RhlE